MLPRLRSWARSLYWLLLTLAACAPPAVHHAPGARESVKQTIEDCCDADTLTARFVLAFEPQTRPTSLNPCDVPGGVRS